MFHLHCTAMCATILVEIIISQLRRTQRSSLWSGENGEAPSVGVGAEHHDVNVVGAMAARDDEEEE
jgi:hypothetical protein